MNTEPLKSKDELHRTIKLLDESIRQLRNIALHNSPVSFEFGLINAINSLVDIINKRAQVKVQFICHAEKLNLTKSFEITVYRIIQELLNNSSKHSNATEIVLQLIKHESSINIVIEDNGKGFDYKKEKKRKDIFGLRRVKQRVELFNGKMQVDSSENSGSIITIELEF
jgi:two-component system NarL family sensor kinase